MVAKKRATKKTKSKPTVKEQRYREFKYHCPVCLKGYSYERKLGCAEHDEFTALLPGPPPQENPPASTLPPEETVPPQPAEEGTPPSGEEPVEEPSEDEEAFAEATRRTMVRAIEPSEKGKMLTRKQWQGLFRLPTDWLNKQLKGFKPDSEYKELATIWIMEDQELNDLADMIYSVLEAYVPQFLIWLAGEGFMNVIAMIIALIMMFGPRVKKTIDFFSKRSKMKKAREEAKNGTV